MIIREIMDNPEEVLATFDYFNDYKDTRSWVSYNCPEYLDALDEGNNRFNEQLRWDTYRITYYDPEAIDPTEPSVYEGKFDSDGAASDYGYSLADKGSYKVEVQVKGFGSKGGYAYWEKI